MTAQEYGATPAQAQVGEPGEERRAGIAVELRNTEFPVMMGMVQRGEFEIARQGYIGEYSDPLAFLELFEEARLTDVALRNVPVHVVGIPGDRFVDHGSVKDLRRVLRLDAPGLAAQVRDTLEILHAVPDSSPAGSAG